MKYYRSSLWAQWVECVLHHFYVDVDRPYDKISSSAPWSQWLLFRQNELHNYCSWSLFWNVIERSYKTTSHRITYLLALPVPTFV